MARFQDLFSRQAHLYARYRPRYPAELFSFLASLLQPQQRRRAWDCATGNGQAAVALAEWFDEVMASDGSAEQLEHATPHSRVEYRRATAYESGLESASVDLVTVATAVHWFDLEAFYKEARRVLQPHGWLAVWTYYYASCGQAALDDLFRHFANDLVRPLFAEGMLWVIEDYRTMPFPFAEVATPSLTTSIEWNRSDFIGYLSSWSATQTYKERYGEDPVSLIMPGLEAAWPLEEERKKWTFPLFMRVGHTC